jgi:hypothetical protein
VVLHPKIEECVRWLKTITPPELHDSVCEMYDYAEGLSLTTEEGIMMNRIWLVFVHGTDWE